MKVNLPKNRIVLLGFAGAALIAAAVIARAFFPGVSISVGPGAPEASAARQEGNVGGSPQNTASAYIAEQLRKGKKPNRLIREKSPYLLQHAFNPVDWYSWGEEAFARARQENKPIFLSVGYSTCYWCHVMEREVFENPEIAEIMNQYVVSIKVDREERPDVDRVYMNALQAMTGSGGWPMSMFLTPDLKPFFGGTYFPPDARYGRPGFGQLVQRIHQVWTQEREKILQSSQQITAILKDQTSVSAGRGAQIAPSVLRRGFDLLRGSYDQQFGGFDSAPKFPRPVTFNLLLRYYRRHGEKAALDMTLSTLKAMARGGIHDHVGQGFHRYSTDAQWRVPHFEKMLYDQAQLVWSYLDAYQITRDDFYAGTARDILDYVLRNLTHKEGGFYSAEDAESALDPSRPEEKEEGTFYLWTQGEIDRILGKPRADIFNFHYGVRPEGNAPSDPQGVFKGKNILYVAHPVEETAKQFGKPSREIERNLAESRKLLFAEREKRPRPHLDDKVLVSWNGLMISAFARAYQVLEDSRYLRAADRAAQFIFAKLRDPKSGQLRRRYREGDARYEAHLEDYAFLTHGLLDLYEASLDIQWLERAIALTETQNKLFWDPKEGGFFDTSGRDKNILLRTKESYDGAEPAGNSIAVLNLLRLSQMTDNGAWREMAEKSLALFAGRLERSPTAMPQMLAAADFHLSKPKQIIIAGRNGSADTRVLLREVHRRYIPNKIILLADGGEAQRKLAGYIPFIKRVLMMEGKATAYVCEDYACELPTSDASVMARLLEGRKARSGQGQS